jgi:endonuclease/exonuclease/phosphatase family metal-dependent hydrolase
MIRAVTANLGCASPSAVGAARVQAADRWAQEQRDARVDLVFAQEVPRGWLEKWAHEYDMAEIQGPSYRVRSALLWRRGRIESERFDLPTAKYHGSYVAAAQLSLPGFDRPIVALSVQASPSVVTQPDLQTWQGIPRDLPEPRTGAGRDAGKLFDADMVLATVTAVRASHLVLAAGDLNECVAWDETHDGRWGADYFDRVSQAGLISIAHRSGSEEQRTAFTHAGGDYQLDHVVTSPEVAAQIDSLVVAPWDEALVATGERSDHAPVSFELN